MVREYLFIGFINLFISFGITNYLVPKVNKLGKDYGFIDIPNERKLKKEYLTRIGGLAIITGFTFSLLINYFWISKSSSDGLNFLPVILLCSIFIFLVGLVDDKNNISPWPRLSFQFIISSIIFSQGIRIDSFYFSFLSNNLASFEIPYFLSFLLTVVWITAIINAINWIDGLDGLAAGISIICSLTFFIKAYIYFDINLILLSSVMLGSSLGFIKYNYSPAKILMGDCGSYFLGLNLALLPIVGSNLNQVSQYNIATPNNLFNVLSSIFFIFIPIFDMTVVIFSRIAEGKSPFLPDKRHLHHKLLNMGFNQKLTLKIIYSISILTSIIGFIFL